MMVGSAETVEVCASGTNAEPNSLTEVALSRDNLLRAYQRVCRNKDAAGVDNMSVDALNSTCNTTGQSCASAYWPEATSHRQFAGSAFPNRKAGNACSVPRLYSIA